MFAARIAAMRSRTAGASLTAGGPTGRPRALVRARPVRVRRAMRSVLHRRGHHGLAVCPAVGRRGVDVEIQRDERPSDQRQPADQRAEVDDRAAQVPEVADDEGVRIAGCDPDKRVRQPWTLETADARVALAHGSEQAQVPLLHCRRDRGGALVLGPGPRRPRRDVADDSVRRPERRAAAAARLGRRLGGTAARRAPDRLRICGWHRANHRARRPFLARGLPFSDRNDPSPPSGRPRAARRRLTRVAAADPGRAAGAGPPRGGHAPPASRTLHGRQAGRDPAARTPSSSRTSAITAGARPSARSSAIRPAAAARSASAVRRCLGRRRRAVGARRRRTRRPRPGRRPAAPRGRPGSGRAGQVRDDQPGRIAPAMRSSARARPGRSSHAVTLVVADDPDQAPLRRPAGRAQAGDRGAGRRAPLERADRDVADDGVARQERVGALDVGFVDPERLRAPGALDEIAGAVGSEVGARVDGDGHRPAAERALPGRARDEQRVAQEHGGARAAIRHRRRAAPPRGGRAAAARGRRRAGRLAFEAPGRGRGRHAGAHRSGPSTRASATLLHGPRRVNGAVPRGACAKRDRRRP